VDLLLQRRQSLPQFPELRINQLVVQDLQLSGGLRLVAHRVDGLLDVVESGFLGPGRWQGGQHTQGSQYGQIAQEAHGFASFSMARRVREALNLSRRERGGATGNNAPAPALVELRLEQVEPAIKEKSASLAASRFCEAASGP